MKDSIIEIEGLWKHYYLNNSSRPRTLKGALLSRFSYWAKREEYWALQDINLSIKSGKTVGLIGNNGAGKSTLLRLISGLSRPTRGKITRNGRLGSLLELGAGFNTEFTGRENVITGSILAGLTRKEAMARVKEVIAFAELEDFIDTPIRTYSSGMFVRLAFSTEINLDPTILLVDEILAVGDLAFQKKCLNQILKMKEQGKTIVVVSHAMGQIETVCDEVVWLEHGKIRAQGATKEIIEMYRNRLFDKISDKPSSRQLVIPNGRLLEVGSSNSETQLLTVGAANSGAGSNIAGATAFELEQTAAPTAPLREQRKGEKVLEIKSVTLLDELGKPVNMIESGEPLVVQVDYIANQTTIQPIIQVGIFSEDDVKCYQVSNLEDTILLGELEGPGRLSLSIGALPLVRGSYYISVGAYQQNWESVYEYHHKICEFTVEGPTTGTGIVYPTHRWQI